MTFGFSQLGLASILAQHRLSVPPNQRDYSWTEREVETLLRDFARSINESDANYFLGTIVTIPRDKDVLEVVDGQQRLATTAIMLAAIRNHLRARDPMIAKAVERVLSVIDRGSREKMPRLQLNLDDNDYFRARLAANQGAPTPSKPSHKLIDAAFGVATKQVENIVAGVDEKDHGDVLDKWITFMEKRAIAVLLTVPTDADAYRMFETLNHRGLRTSQSDLVKNYLFGRSGQRIEEVQQRWSLMRGAIETLGDDDGLTIRFLRHSITLIDGFVRENEVYEAVQVLAKSPQPTVSFTGDLASLSTSYVSTYNADHEHWNRSDAAKRAIEVLNLFDIKPLRPVLFAIAEQLGPREVERALKFCVSLAVRLMIAGSTRTGSVEEGLAGAAHKLYVGDVEGAAGLKKRLASLTPSDTQFRLAFEGATVSNAKLARYYLRSMESAHKGESQPWHIPNADRDAINLEHVLPRNPENNWPQFTEEEAKLYLKRIGNLCLLRGRDNSAAKSADFETKRVFYRHSPYSLTSEIGQEKCWGREEIAARQRRLGKIAVRTWRV